MLCIVSDFKISLRTTRHLDRPSQMQTGGRSVKSVIALTTELIIASIHMCVDNLALCSFVLKFHSTLRSHPLLYLHSSYTHKS